jgi:hypothetical protein
VINTTEHHCNYSNESVGKQQTNQEFKIILLYVIPPQEILAGKVHPDSIILLDAFDGELVFRNQSELVH